jgi:hypothetical protein
MIRGFVLTPALAQASVYDPEAPLTEPVMVAPVGYTPAAASKIASPALPAGFLAIWIVPAKGAEAESELFPFD